MTEVEDKFILELQRCLGETTMFFQRRDQMNARLHRAEVRDSPLAQFVEETYRKVNQIVNRNSLHRIKHDSDSDTSEG